MKINFNYRLYYFIQFTWGIIQNALGFFVFVYLFFKYDEIESFYYQGSYVTKWKARGSMSLGIFIFVDNDDYRVLAHEYGHTIQSCILGPFYLLLVGIPSFLWASLPILRKLRRKRRIRYSSFYTEKWANYLGKKYTGENTISF